MDGRAPTRRAGEEKTGGGLEEARRLLYRGRPAPAYGSMETTS